MQGKDVTVVISCYNQQDTICRAVDSVLMQVTDFRFRIVVCDDGSTDDSWFLLQKYYSVINNVWIYTNNNRGVMLNYVHGFIKFTGDYIAVLDGDDYWADKNKLQMQVDYMIKTKVGLCFTDCKIIPWGETNSIGTPLTFNSIVMGNFITWSTVMFDCKQSFEMFTAMCCHKKWLQDLFVVLWFANYSKIGYIPSVTSCYTVNENSKSHGSNTDRVKYILSAFSVVMYFMVRRSLNVNLLFRLNYKLAHDLFCAVTGRWKNK